MWHILSILLFLLAISQGVHAALGGSQVLIYNGRGTIHECVNWTLKSFGSLLNDPLQATTVNTQTLLDTKWMHNAKFLVIPGGRANLYNRKLGDLGMANIKEFVHDGNIVIGLCAGAYFTAKNSYFAVGKKSEIIDYHLGFFPGNVIGPYFEDFNYLEKTVKNINIECSDGNTRSVYSHGGGWFVDPEKYPNITVLAKYISDLPEKDELAAIIKIKYGNGFVLASHVHFEHDNCWCDWKDFIADSLSQENLS